MPPKPKPNPKFNTLTTLGRLQKAAHDHDRELSTSTSTSASASTTSPNPTSQPSMSSSPPPVAAASEPPKKKRKPTTLPPPSEIAAEAARKAQLKKKPAKAKKPLTTLGKLKAVEGKKAAENKKAVESKKPAESKKANESKKYRETKKPDEASKKTTQPETVVHDGVELKVVESGLWKEPGSDSNSKFKAGERPTNLMSIMRGMGQMDGMGLPKGRKKGGAAERQSVLVRPTEKTRRIKLKDPEGRGPVVLASEPGRAPRAGLMSLKEDTRKRIWGFVVVERRFFVYPAMATEQPDLAMTCKQIRGEVLPIFYGGNTFAIEVLAAGSLNLAQKWVDVFEKTDVLGMIGKWAFVCTLPQGGTKTPNPNRWRNAQDVVVTLQHPDAGAWRNALPKVEIHEQALCILPGHDEYKQCTLKGPVTWLEDAIAATALGEQYNRGEQALRLARLLQKRGGELVGNRCHGARVAEEVYAADEIKAMNPKDTAFKLHVARGHRDDPYDFE